MYEALNDELLRAGAVLLLAVAAEDGRVDPREVGRSADTLATWGRCDRLRATQHVEQAFAELGQLWNLGGHAELDRHLWLHAGTLAEQLDWHRLNALVAALEKVASADGGVDRTEQGLIDAIRSFFDRESAPPEDLDALSLLERFPLDSRGEAWTQRFLARIAKTPIEVGDPAARGAPTPRIFEGVGGFRLAEGRLRSVGGGSLAFWEIARVCTDEGLGLHLEPGWTDPPGHVFRLGEMWAFRAFDGVFSLPPLARAPRLDELMPRWAREHLARVFDYHGLPGRQVTLLTSPAGEPTLAFDAPPHFLPDRSLHTSLEKALRWATPPGMLLITVDPAQNRYAWEPL